ncbi:MAG: hypothetical protein LBE13_20260 [Bacteroidales bacterium]|jgi:hypothetical protein|nr:hypothetical protein [Bacteroidales bacterium]
MDKNLLIGEIKSYIESLSDDVFPKKYKNSASIILSGSTGWGIKEGSDKKADWDLHVILTDNDYKDFSAVKGEDYTIDDQKHEPVVFVQFHNLKWLYERLNGFVPNAWPLYLWIYTNCIYVSDPNNISGIVDEYKNKFKSELPELIKTYHITFSVRRLDTCTSASRNLSIATGINRSEMVKAALQTMCLIKEQPFSYNKWLAKEVELLYQEDEKIVEIINVCEKCLFETDLALLIQYSKTLRDLIENLVLEKIGDKRWIHYWWEFNKN